MISKLVENSWRAGCLETCTSGSAGDSPETCHSNMIRRRDSTLLRNAQIQGQADRYLTITHCFFHAKESIALLSWSFAFLFYLWKKSGARIISNW